MSVRFKISWMSTHRVYTVLLLASVLAFAQLTPIQAQSNCVVQFRPGAPIEWSINLSRSGGPLMPQQPGIVDFVQPQGNKLFVRFRLFNANGSSGSWGGEFFPARGLFIANTGVTSRINPPAPEEQITGQCFGQQFRGDYFNNGRADGTFYLNVR